MATRTPRSSSISWRQLTETYDPQRRTYQPIVYYFGGAQASGLKKDARRPFYVRDNE